MSFILTSCQNACTENVLLTCVKCYKTEVVTHSHNNCRIAYTKDEGNSNSNMIIKSNKIEVLANL